MSQVLQGFNFICVLQKTQLSHVQVLIYYKWGLFLENQFENKFSFFLIIKFPLLYLSVFPVFCFYLFFFKLSCSLQCHFCLPSLFLVIDFTCYSFISCFSFSHTSVLLAPRENWHETIWCFLQHRLSCCRMEASAMYTSHNKNHIVINH